MPLRGYRRRCNRRMACCMPLPRACVDSMPRYYMPHYPIYYPDPPNQPHAPASSSSQSDCSCGEENFCTIDSCRNAPMCLRTRPQFCPYGLCDRIDGEFHRPRSAARRLSRVPAETDYPRGHYSTRNEAARPVYPQGASSPLQSPSPEFRRTAENQWPNMSRYRREFPESSVQDNSYPPFQRFTQTRLSNAMPQFMHTLPGPQYSQLPLQPPALYRPQSDIFQSRAHTEQAAFAPSAQLPANDSVTDSREAFREHSPMYFDQSYSHVGPGESRKEPPQEADCARVRSTKRGVKSTCCKNNTYHDDAPDTADGAGKFPVRYEKEVDTGRIQDVARPTVMETRGNFADIGYSDPPVHSPTMPKQAHLCCSPTPKAPDLSTRSATKGSVLDLSKCPCRYPPSYKHLSCSGNNSGSCECDQQMQIE
ncbi:unnamed protein product, partial [Iphiclides podalirius]